MITLTEPNINEWNDLVGKKVYVEFNLLKGEKAPFKEAFLMGVFENTETVLFEKKLTRETIVATFQAISLMTQAD